MSMSYSMSCEEAGVPLNVAKFGIALHVWVHNCLTILRPVA
jgi:hypothetical protein